MFRENMIQHWARFGSIRSVCLPFFLILLIIPSLPIHAADTDITPESVPVASAADIAASPEDLKPADQASVVLSEPEQNETIIGVKPEDNPIINQEPLLRLDQLHPEKSSQRMITAGLLLLPLDKGMVKMFPRTPAGESTDGFTNMIDKLGGREVLLGAIGGMYLLGDADDKDTAKLALAALADAVITTEGIKILAGRERPGSSRDSLKFHGPSLDGKNYKSFPSGHTSAVFAVATVLANKHPKQKWLYYGLATAVGYARVRKSAHFPSDVLVGAAIGINAGNNAVRNGPRIFSIKL